MFEETDHLYVLEYEVWADRERITYWDMGHFEIESLGSDRNWQEVREGGGGWEWGVENALENNQTKQSTEYKSEVSLKLSR